MLSSLRPSLRSRSRAALSCTLLVASVALVAPAANATEIPVDGVLRSAQGNPVPDGIYALTFRLYTTEKEAEALWIEVHVGVQVEGGRFRIALGKTLEGKVLPATVLAEHPGLWLGVQVSIDPEMPRARLSSTPYAGYAEIAGTVLGGVGVAQVNFTYAGSDSKGGPAVALKCTGCIGSKELAAGAVEAKHLAAGAVSAAAVTFLEVGGAATVQGALGELRGALKIDGSSVGVAKVPGGQCAFDVATDSGHVCLDGKPARVVRLAASGAEMDKVAVTGQVIYRTDEDEAYLFRKGKWRKLIYAPQCGDGELEVGEECDEGDQNADKPDMCRTTCKKPGCGDGIVDSTEQCDDGNYLPTDTCIACTNAVCGDGHVQAGVEACDDGNADKTDACVSCKQATCGDGAVQTGVETCDGLDVGNATCASVKGGGNWKGTLACADGCKAFNVDGCVQELYLDSKILTAQQQATLNGWVGAAGQTWKLCYRLSDDGANSGTFHAKCDGKGASVSLMRASGGPIFGGYNASSWVTNATYSVSPGSFIFSVSKGTKYQLKDNNSGNATYSNTGYGPTFGGGHDLYIKPSMTTGYTNFGHTYDCPWGYSSSTCRNYFAGSYDGWTLDELEVYIKQ